MKCQEKSLDQLTADEITTALRAAIPARDVGITAITDPNGALVEACCVEVYVMFEAQQSALSIRCWHAYNAEPYKTLEASTLDDAISLVKAEFAG